MFDCIPRVEIKRESSIILLLSSGEKSTDSAIKFEWNCPVLNRTFHVVWSDGILRREKAYISIGFSPEFSKLKTIAMWSEVPLLIPCKQQVKTLSLTFSILDISRLFFEETTTPCRLDFGLMKQFIDH